MIRKIAYQIRDTMRLIRLLRLKGVLKYIFSLEKLINVNIHETRLWIRKSIPDLSAARSFRTNEFHILKHLYPSNYSGIIVDAGGYIGTAAIDFTKMYPNARIITIEPSKENLEVLRRNVAPYPNIHIVAGALSDISNKKRKLMDIGTGTYGFTIIESLENTPNAVSIGKVTCYRLTDLVNKIEKIGILKLDIEGSEKAIFETEKELLKNIPVIMVELHDRKIKGCSESFFEFSKERWILKDQGEKYISLNKGIKL